MSMNATRNSQIAKRYAQALFLAAKENSAQLNEEFKQVLAILEDPVVNRAFYHPLTSRERKTELVRLMQLSELMESFLLLVVEKGREALLPAIGQAFLQLVLDQQNTTVAQVTSARRLDAQEQAELQRKLSALTGKKVILNAYVDASIIGGLVVQVDGKILDASLRHRLDMFVHSLTS